MENEFNLLYRIRRDYPPTDRQIIKQLKARNKVYKILFWLMCLIALSILIFK
jgi:hypothetical protein